MTINYQLAGLSDLNGHMGRQVPAGQIVVPQKIWLRDDSIHWRMGSNPRTRGVSPSMLNQFIGLTDAHSVLGFAREWGVLALSDNLSSAEDPKDRFYVPGRDELKKGTEPVSVWQYFSKRAKALLNIVAALKRGRLGDMSDWDEFATFYLGKKDQVQQWIIASADRHIFGLGFRVLEGRCTQEERLRWARQAMAQEIRDWLDCWKRNKPQGVSDFAMRWIDGQQRWELQIDYHGLLFSAIALQLALVLADADSLYTCSGCGIPYIRPRERKRPKSGWANYCAQCSKDGVAQRRAAETYREKRAEAVRLLSGGTSASEVARQLNTDVARVQEWLKSGDKDAKAKTRK